MVGVITVLVLTCGLMAFLAAVLVISAVIAGGRAKRFEESDEWWAADQEE